MPIELKAKAKRIIARIMRYCLRCGINFQRPKGERNFGGCSVYGKFYKRHLWNRKLN